MLHNQGPYNLHFATNMLRRTTSLIIQGVTGGTDQTSGECSLGHTITI